MLAYVDGREGALRVVAVNEAGKIGSGVTSFPIGNGRIVGEYGQHGPGDQRYSWSPGGQKILLNQASWLNPPVYFVFDVRIGKGTLLSHDNGKGESYRNGAGPWSDDGKRLVFYQQGHVYVVNSDGTGRIDLGEGESPQWSPDGKKITYGQTETFGREVVGQYIFVVNSDGTGKVKIAEGINPRWIPATSWK
jgi:Tol biopolymer transport system component